MKVTFADISEVLFKDRNLIGTEHPSDDWGSHVQNLWNLADYLRNRPETVEIPSNAHYGTVAHAIGKGLRKYALPASSGPVRLNIARGLAALRQHRDESFRGDSVAV